MRIESSFVVVIYSCGALHCGDQINAIDQKSFDGMSLAEANAVLRACIGEFCRIEVMPASSFGPHNMIIDQPVEPRLQSPQSRGRSRLFQFDIYRKMSSVLVSDSSRQTCYRAPASTPLPLSHGTWTVRNSYQNITRKSSHKTRHNSMSKRVCEFVIHFS